MSERRPYSLREVEEAFKRLRPLHRQMMVWYWIDELTYDEMAARLGISRKRFTRKMGRLIYRWCRALEVVAGERDD